MLFGRGEMLGKEEPEDGMEALREKVALLEKIIRGKEVTISLLEEARGRV